MKDENQVICPPFMVVESLGEIGFKTAHLDRDLGNVRRVAVVDQTPAHNLVGFLLPEWAEKFVVMCNRESADPQKEVRDGH